MKKVFKLFMAGAAVLAVAWGFPAQSFAVCPVSLPLASCQTAGMSFIGTVPLPWGGPGSPGMGGSFWWAGNGDPLIGPGTDSGRFGLDSGDPTPFGPYPWQDFVIGDGSSGERCWFWDWGSAGTDGCPLPAGPTEVVVGVNVDTNNNYAVWSVGGLGGVYDLDFILLNTGGVGTLQPMVPNAFGSLGIPLSRGVHVLSSSAGGGSATVSVAPLAYNYFDDAGNARFPTDAALNAQLYGMVGGAWTPLGGPGVHVVDSDSDLCWGFDTGEFVPTKGDGVVTADLGVACVRIGGVTAVQSVDRATVAKGKGLMKFEWHVTAQLDIAGFDIVAINPTKGTSRTLNASPIFSGQNDATDEAYSVTFPRSVVKRPGVFELRMTRQDGSVTTTPFVYE